MDKDKYSLGPSTAPTSPLVPLPQQPECDYDTNPTILYQAIEAKQWDYAASLFVEGKCEGQSGTWVVRKETNGKLRWRLLPLHAAIIFGSPLTLIECLLADYPTAAQCKDDQGMLPLHLAFRNEGSASWEIIEELLTAYPHAIFVKDRKGRTPLQCGIQLTTANMSSNMSVSSAPQQSKTFKSIVKVLDVYSQVVVSGERQRSQLEARKQAEARISQIQEAHLQTLTSLKREWHTQHEEAKKQLNAALAQKQVLSEKVLEQESTIENLGKIQVELQEKLDDLSLSQGNVQTLVSTEKMANNVLRSVVEDLAARQKEYHLHLHALVEKYERLIEERKKILQIFQAQSESQIDQEVQIVQDMKNWLHDKERVLSQPPRVIDEALEHSDEKKVETVRDFCERDELPRMPPKSLSSETETDDKVIDLATVGSDA